MMNEGHAFIQKVYAGILGKIIGVYLGRPIENWTYESIKNRFGQIDRFVNDDLDLPLIVTDDDITGTLTFIRAVEDFNFPAALTSEQIGKTWLNYVINQRSVFWWGGFGNSTEHTAYIRLNEGIPAPKSGSAALNGKVISEQIGAQIFIDAWAMLAPADPEKAAYFAEAAARVSHDGEAVNAAVMLAVMESLAFTEHDLNVIVDHSLQFIPGESIIYRMIQDVRNWREKYPHWQQTREQIARVYGYGKFKGVVHVVPNHALIHLGLLYGNDDLKDSLMITNTAGWDTDCNSGNVGCFLGIKNGMDCFTGLEDWRLLVNDRLYVPTADGGAAISDALRESYKVANLYHKMNAKPLLAPKNGARFHFSISGSTQAFFALDLDEKSDASVEISNKENPFSPPARLLSIAYQVKDAQPQTRIVTPTFVPHTYKEIPGYALDASPTLYPGQQVRMKLISDGRNTGAVQISPLILYYGPDDRLVDVKGKPVELKQAGAQEISWAVPETIDGPIVYAGFCVDACDTRQGEIYLDYLTWQGTPHVVFKKPAHASIMWQKAWIKDVDGFDTCWPESFRIIQNSGTGLLIQGAREWRDYMVTADITPHLMASGGLAFYVQGRKKYYAFVLRHPNQAILRKMSDDEKILGEVKFPWSFENTYTLSASTEGRLIKTFIDGREIFRIVDDDQPLSGGAAAYICEQGCFSSECMQIEP